MSAVDGNKEVLKEGFLVKKGHIRHNWKSRWFVLDSDTLRYFKSKGDFLHKGSVHLKGCSVISPDPEYTKKECVFRLIEIHGTEYLLQCSNEIDREDWVQKIGNVIRKLEASSKTNSIKVSNRPTLHSPMPSPERERKATNSPALVVLQNRVTHEDLMVAMQDSEAGLTLKNHHVGDDVFKLCFSGDELVTWLHSWSFVQSREEGRIIANELLEKVYLHPVGPISQTSQKRKVARKAFLDTDNALYRFSTISLNSGMDIDFDISDSSDESDQEDELILENLQGIIIKQGFLVKKGHVRHNWKVRKFVLYDEPAKLFYFNPTKGEKEKKGRIKLLDSKVKALIEDEDTEDTSGVKGCKSVVREHCFLVRTVKGSKYILQAPSKEEMKEWVRLLQQIIQKYDT